MPDFNSNNPVEFGWDPTFTGFPSFFHGGFSFPQGVHPWVAPIFHQALQRLLTAGLVFPPLRMGLGAGMWGAEQRSIAGTNTRSFHSFGLAIDVCAPWNPAGVANPNPSPYRLPDETSDLVEPLGLLWGGSPRFGSRPDRMHLECHLSPSEVASSVPAPRPSPPGPHPFPLPRGYYYGPLDGPTESISGLYRTDGPYRPGLAMAQHKLGCNADGFFGAMTAAAARSWQQHHSLTVDGLIGVSTWTSLFPA